MRVWASSRACTSLVFKRRRRLNWLIAIGDRARLMRHVSSLPKFCAAWERTMQSRAVAILRLAIVETSAKRYNDALHILTESAQLFEAAATHAMKGKFYNELASVLNYLSVTERRRDYADRALVEYTAAGFHFEQAKHTRNQAAVENNLGYLFATLGNFAEAHTHLERARRLFVRLKDTVHSAQVDETRARAFIAAGRYAEAERLARLAAGILSKGGELALLSETLTTHGIALARLGRHVPARAAFLRSAEVAELAGEIFEGAGLAALGLIEARRRTHTRGNAGNLRACRRSPF